MRALRETTRGKRKTIAPGMTQQAIQWSSFLPYDVAAELAADPAVALVGRERRVAAVALFADISGFTAISEALGAGGAEELTRILNAYFTPVIALIQSYGGIVAKFGGDSLTAFFPHEPGEDGPAARRAVACALALQDQVASHRDVEVAGAVFNLGMRAGLAAGELLCTVVGDEATRLESIVAGGVLERAAAAEALAAPGEVVAHHDLLPALGAARAEPRDSALAGARFFAVLGNAAIPDPAPLAPLPPLSDEAVRRIGAFLPPAIARRLDGDEVGFVSEHRAVTAVFLGFDGFDYDGDPGVGAKLQGFLGQVFATVGRFGGYVNKVDMGDKGSKALILFGAPVAHADDAERALECALELRALAAPAGAAAVRLGVTAGAVFSGQVGSASRQEYTVIGDTVNLAARLMQAAAPGQILVAAAARRAAGARFSWAGQAELRVKGRAAPVVAAILAGVGAAGAGEQAGRALVGRADELALLRQRIELAARGRGQVVALGGEAGIGKSTLAMAALREAARRGYLGLTGECVSYRSASGYLVWRPVLRRLLGLEPGWTAERQLRHLEERLGALDERLAKRLPLLGPILGLSMEDSPVTAGLEGEARKAATEALVCDLVALAPAPVAIVLEGCDWIDPLARDLLLALARRAAALPALIILTYRGAPDEREDWAAPLRGAGLHHLTELRLGELARPEVEALVAATVARHFGPDAVAPMALVELVAARAQGNPLFVEELLALVHDRGIDLGDPGLRHDEGAEAVAALELPDSLHSLVLSRIDRLDEGAQTAIKVASVIGQEFSPSWLAGVYPPLAEGARLDRQLEALRRSDLAVLERAGPEPSYMFRHVITRDVAYSSLARATRSALHERTGAYIERAYAGELERHLDLLAYHYGLSDNQLKQREYFHRAGLAAQLAFNAEAAASFYERLLPLLHRSERSAVLLRLGEVLRHSGRWAEAEERFREALDLAPDAATAGRARPAPRAPGGRRGAHGAAPPGPQQRRAAPPPPSDRAGDGEALEQLGMVAWYTGDYGAALELLERALARGGTDDPRRAAQLLNNAGLVYWARQEHGRALDCFERSLRAATAAGNRQHAGVAVGNIGNVHLDRGDYGKALDCYQQKLQCALDIGDRMELGICIGNFGTIYESQGEYGRAAACFTRALALALDLGDQLGVGLALWSLGTAAMGEGRLDESESLLARSAAVLRAIDATYELCACQASLAELAHRRGEHAAALALLADALPMAEASGHADTALRCRLLAAECERSLGRRRAAELAEDLARLLPACASDEERAAVHYTLARVDGARADDRAAASRLYRELHMRTPNAEYRRRYLALMGVALPTPAPLPALPAAVGEPPLDLAALDERVAELVDDVAAPMARAA